MTSDQAAIDVLVLRDFGALEAAAMERKAFSEVALARILNHLDHLPEDRATHWRSELRRIGATQ